jgi:hypothetical protein
MHGLRTADSIRRERDGDDGPQHRLGVIVEEVETAGQFDALFDSEADEVQDYVLGRHPWRNSFPNT